MKLIERKSLWHHTVFSLCMVTILAVIIFVKHDVPSLILAALIVLYIAGNTIIHIIRHDFRTETLYEYLLVGMAVFIVMVSAFNH